MLGSSALASEVAKWNLAPPTDLKRAAPDIYRGIRASGSGGVRERLASEYRGSRASSLCTDLWRVATHIDFILGEVGSPAEALPWLRSVLSNLSSEPAHSQDGDTGASLGPITGHEDTALHCRRKIRQIRGHVILNTQENILLNLPK